MPHQRQAFGHRGIAPVGARAGHRVEHIRHRHDPPLQRDLLAPQPGRIARTIQPLMVAADHIGHQRRGWILGNAVLVKHLGENRHTLLHMGAHHGHLAGIQPARLEQNHIRDADLADVVQAREQTDLLDVGGGAAVAGRHALGNQPRDPAHPLQVVAGFKIPQAGEIMGHLRGPLQALQRLPRRLPQAAGEQFRKGRQHRFLRSREALARARQKHREKTGPRHAVHRHRPLLPQRRHRIRPQLAAILLAVGMGAVKQQPAGAAPLLRHGKTQHPLQLGHQGLGLLARGLQLLVQGQRQRPEARRNNSLGIAGPRGGSHNWRTVIRTEAFPMNAISYSTARAHLAGTMNQVCEDHEPVVITRRGEPAVVMLSLEDYKAMEETSYLLRSPANAQRLMRSITSLNSNQGEEHDLLPCD